MQADWSAQSAAAIPVTHGWTAAVREAAEIAGSRFPEGRKPFIVEVRIIAAKEQDARPDPQS